MGRKDAASPAVGFPRVHREQQEKILEEAFKYYTSQITQIREELNREQG